MRAAIIAFIVLAGSAGCGTAHAAQLGIYAGISYAMVEKDSTRSAFEDEALLVYNAFGFSPTSTTASLDPKDSSYGFVVGWRLTEHIALEGGYLDLGRFTYSANMPTVATRDGSLKMNAWNLDVVGSYPLGSQFSVFGKLGVAAHRAKFHCEGTGIACSNPSRKASGTSLHYGVGVEWAFSPNWFARAEYEVVKKVGDPFNATGTTGTSRADVKLGSIGIGYRF